MSRFLPIFLAPLLLGACVLPGSDTGGSTPFVQHEGYTGSFEYEIELGPEPRDLYFVFTNTSLWFPSFKRPSVSSIKIDGLELAAPAPQALADAPAEPSSAGEFLAASRRNPTLLKSSALAGPRLSLAPSPPAFDTVGLGSTYSDLNAAGDAMDAAVPATCRSVVPSVAVADGSTRTLNIWVADDCWDDEIDPPYVGKKHGVTQMMVDALAGKFLAAGPGNDIYDWVTALLGPEWGITGSGELIPPTGEITILISDIQADNADDGGIVGYFWPGNNFAVAEEAESNERIMFVVDAVMYANPSDDGTEDLSAWADTDFWAKELFSTLVHEFQHMIHFYRKGILIRGDGSSAETWIDEMCAQIAEDLVAEKLEVEGPRGVAGTDPSAGSPGNDLGRIPDFNDSLANSLVDDSGPAYGLDDYASSYAFGAWLARNYGGAALLKRIVWDYADDAAAVERAVSAESGRDETLPELLSRWAVSVLASSRSDLPPGYAYNRGAAWTTSSAEGIDFRLGSIDFFNYVPAPTVSSAAGLLPSSGYFLPSSNLYFRAASAATGKRSFSLEVPEGIDFSVYASP